MEIGNKVVLDNIIRFVESGAAYEPEAEHSMPFLMLAVLMDFVTKTSAADAFERKLGSRPAEFPRAIAPSNKAQSYAAYLNSEEWRIRREQMLVWAEGRCQVCNSSEQLNVHHRTYAQIFDEHPRDLAVLCNECHLLYHHRMP